MERSRSSQKCNCFAHQLIGAATDCGHSVAMNGHADRLVETENHDLSAQRAELRDFRMIAAQVSLMDE